MEETEMFRKVTEFISGQVRMKTQVYRLNNRALSALSSAHRIRPTRYLHRERILPGLECPRSGSKTSQIGVPEQCSSSKHQAPSASAILPTPIWPRTGLPW